MTPRRYSTVVGSLPAKGRRLVGGSESATRRSCTGTWPQPRA